MFTLERTSQSSEDHVVMVFLLAVFVAFAMSERRTFAILFPVFGRRPSACQAYEWSSMQVWLGPSWGEN